MSKTHKQKIAKALKSYRAAPNPKGFHYLAIAYLDSIVHHLENIHKTQRQALELKKWRK